MSNLDSLAMAWVGGGWSALLAFTAAALLVAALRRPCRRLFGTERAFQLWLLPPLAVLGRSQSCAPNRSSAQRSCWAHT